VINIREIIEDLESISALDDNCLCAIERLVQNGDPRSDILLQILESANNERSYCKEVEGAIWGLGKLKDPRSVQPLISLLNNTSDIGPQLRVINALGEIGDTRALRPILGLRHKNQAEETGDAIINALCAIEVVSPGEIWNLLEDQGFHHTFIILSAINRILGKGSRRHIPSDVETQLGRISLNFEHADPKVRLAAIQICLKLDKNYSSENLYNLLNDRDEQVNREISMILAKRQDPVGFREIIRHGFLEDKRLTRRISFSKYSKAALDGAKLILQEVEEFDRAQLVEDFDLLDDVISQNFDRFALLENVKIALKEIGNDEAMKLLEEISEE
jgi:hypothetical protein